jgi:S1-C subfamily serine protease
MKNLAIAIALTMTMLAASSETQAQSQRQSTRVQQQLYVQPPVQVTPKLGVTGHIVAHWGFKIKSVEPYSAAARMGLERGDVIKMINHKQIDCLHAFKAALQQAATYNGGNLLLKVDNVRARLGLSHQRIVMVNGNLFAATPVVYATSH